MHEISTFQFLHHDTPESVHVGLREWNTGMWTARIIAQPPSILQGRHKQWQFGTIPLVPYHWYHTTVILPDTQTHHSLHFQTALVAPVKGNTFHIQILSKQIQHGFAFG